MSFRGRGGGGGGGGRGGRGGGHRGGGGFRGGRGGGGERFHDYGPPQEVIEVGEFTHTCENDIVCKCTCGKIPFFNAPIYFQNKEKIGKIDEIFGSLLDNGFSVTLSDGVKSASFKLGQKLYIDPAKLMPIERFLPGNTHRGRGRGGRGRGADRGRGGRGDRGGFRGGRGGSNGDRGGRGRGGFRNDQGGRGGFGNDRGGRGGFGHDRGGYGRSGNDRGGGFKRSFDSGSGGQQSKRIKFD
ncbi:hypothetical protein Angca_008759, partial [Angiostrongylus cantonensis]